MLSDLHLSLGESVGRGGEEGKEREEGEGEGWLDKRIFSVTGLISSLLLNANAPIAFPFFS